MAECNHGSVRVLKRDKNGSLFECIHCGMVTEHPGITVWRNKDGSEPVAQKMNSDWVKEK